MGTEQIVAGEGLFVNVRRRVGGGVNVIWLIIPIAAIIGIGILVGMNLLKKHKSKRKGRTTRTENETLVLSLPLALSLLAAPAYALEYTSDGPPQDTFRDTTSAEGYTWTEPNIDRIKDAAHFQNTSIWGDNVCLVGHNRGTNEIFGKIHKLNVGDTITLTTKLGTDERQANALTPAPCSAVCPLRTSGSFCAVLDHLGPICINKICYYILFWNRGVWNMKKWLISLILTCLLALQLAGCGPAVNPGSSEREGESASAQVPVTMLYTIDLSNFEALVEETYPDIDLQIERNAEATIDGESERRLRTGHGSDIITTTMPTGDVRGYALDLSAQEFASAYQAGISQSLLIDGKPLFLLLPGQYFGYIYNATLAGQAGVTEAPATTSALLSMLDAAAAQGLGLGSDGVMFAIESNDMTTVSSYFIGTQVPDFLGRSEGAIWRERLTKREEPS